MKTEAVKFDCWQSVSVQMVKGITNLWQYGFLVSII